MTVLSLLTILKCSMYDKDGWINDELYHRKGQKETQIVFVIKNRKLRLYIIYM